MVEILYRPAFGPSNPLLDSRIRGLPDFLFGAPPPLVWGNPFMATRVLPPAPTPPSPSPSPSPSPLSNTPTPLSDDKAPLGLSQVDDDVTRIRMGIIGRGNKKKSLNDVLIDILPNRSYDHRTQFIDRYSAMYRANLLDDLSKQVKPHNFFFAVRAMLELYRLTRMHSLFIAMEGKATGRFLSLEGLGTDESALAEILFMATNSQIKFCRINWKRFYPSFDLENQLQGETSGNFSRLLFALTQGDRDESGNVDFELVKADVRELQGDEEKRASKFIEIFSRRSHEHLSRLIGQFENSTGEDMNSFITTSLKSFTGQMIGDDFITSLKMFINAVRDEVKFYAQRLNQCVEFLTLRSINQLPIDVVSSRQTIVRILILRREIDLAEIKQRYSELSGTQLETSILNCFKDTKFAPLSQLLLSIVRESEEPLLPEVAQLEKIISEKGKGTHIVLSILSSCDYKKRLKIARQYNLTNQVNLLSKAEEFLKSKELLFTLRALTETHEVTCVRSLWMAMEGKGSGKLFSKEVIPADVLAVTDILFQASNKDLSYFNEFYPKYSTGYNLMDHVRRETGNGAHNGNGHLSTLLQKILECKRADNIENNTELIKEDVVKLHQLANAEHPHDIIIELFAYRSREHLRVVFNDFEGIYEDTIANYVHTCFRTRSQDDFLQALANFVGSIQDPEMYYAQRLSESFNFIREKNGNSLESMSQRQSVLRIIIARAEIDLDRIADRFIAISKGSDSLEKTIQDVIKEVGVARILLDMLSFKQADLLD